MALKAATDWVADAPYTYQAIQVEPKLADMRTGEQKVNADGVLAWTVDALRTAPGQPATTISVTVHSHTQPQIDPLTQVTFQGLRGFLWDNRKSNAFGVAWSADSVTAL